MISEIHEFKVSSDARFYTDISTSVKLVIWIVILKMRLIDNAVSCVV